jgi:glycosyltransferase involved in cell wall biosynthesis
MRSVAGHGGALLVDPTSVAAIRAGFRKLIDDPASRGRFVAAGLENCGRFTFAAIAARYLELYRALGEQ